MAITPNMNLDLPVVSTTLGPEWASDLNAALDLVDSHDHSSGKGVKVTPAGLDINASVNFQGNTLTQVLAILMQAADAAATSNTGSIQRVGSDLYWVNGAGNAVQITSGNSIVSTGSGTLVASTPGAYPYTISIADAQRVLLVNTSSARTINLPAATVQLAVCIKDISGLAQTNNISIVPDGTDVIDGVNATFPLRDNYGAIFLISDGSAAWHIF
jgi:hypothetical protein